jgi:hypothetical protein
MRVERTVIAAVCVGIAPDFTRRDGDTPSKADPPPSTRGLGGAIDDAREPPDPRD